jgi:hypothetical protein
MKRIIEVYESQVNGQKAIFNSHSRLPVEDPQPAPVGRPVLLREGLSLDEQQDFIERIRKACPKDANGYSLRGQIRQLRYVQFYRGVSDEPFTLSGIANHEDCENNCIPGIPK